MTESLQGIAKLQQARTLAGAARYPRAVGAPRSFAVELSWPPAELMQNRNDGRHWTYAASERATYKHEGYLLALAAINESKFDPRDGTDFRIVMTFHPPDAKRRDVSNLFAAMKSALDGIAGAMGVDDYHFAEHTARRGARADRGRVDVVVQILQ